MSAKTDTIETAEKQKFTPDRALEAKRKSWYENYQKIAGEKGEQLKAAPGMAKIVLQVTDFLDVLAVDDSPRKRVPCTKMVMRAEAGHDRVRVTPASGENQSLWVSKGEPMVFQFLIEGRKGEKADTYLPIGIAFTPKGKASDKTPLDASGCRTFLENGNLYFLGAEKVFTDKAEYNFYAIIQKEGNGHVGVIDPDVHLGDLN
jgi:hypothetical protein